MYWYRWSLHEYRNHFPIRMTYYTDAEREIESIVDDGWTFEQIESLVRLGTHYNDGEAFDAAHEIAERTIWT